MAHTLDGYDVRVGDAVYDVAYGAGKVTLLADNGGITVKFGDGRTAGYTDGRTRRFTQRTLFWQNPVIAAPPKGENLWRVIRSMAAAAANTIKSVEVKVDG